MPWQNITKQNYEKIVVDTNILIAAILRDGTSRQMITKRSGKLYSPHQALFEIREHEIELRERNQTTEAEFEELVKFVHDCVYFITQDEFGAYFSEAITILPSDHHDDWPFLALAMKLQCPIWSNDSALKQQKVVKIYSTAELLTPD